MKYPSEIITDMSIDKYLTDDAFTDLKIPADNDIINKVLYYTSQFLTQENIYNVNGAYNFGLIPYYYAQIFISSQSSLHDTFNDIVNDYNNRINTVNDYNNRINTVNDYKVKILFIHLLAVLTDNIDNENINALLADIVDKLSTLKGIQNVVDTYDIITVIDSMIDNVIDKLDSNMHIPSNNTQRLAEMMLQKKYGKSYLTYIYTSFIIYHPVTMRMNGMTTEFLLSKVYEDIINYAIYNTLVNNSFVYSHTSWSDWTHVKQVADKDMIYHKDNITVMNVNKFLTSTFQHDALRNVYNIFNIDAQYIIIHKGVTIDFSADISVIIAGLIDWSSKFYMLFKPLKNLWNYYRVNKVNNYDVFARTIDDAEHLGTFFTINSGDEDAKHLPRTKGSLYSVYDGVFTLIDVKNYDYSDTYSTPAKLRNLYYHTILQTWMYMNAYIKPIGMMNDKRLYTYHLAVINPCLNDMIVCDYDKVTAFTKDIDLSKYRFNTTM